MNSRRPPRGRRGYHHGNLREALIEAALKLLAERGPEGVTLSEAARMAGVSPAAPYRHFRDRGNLIGAVALDGFRTFADKLEETAAAGSDDPLDVLNRIGAAYLEFARREPAYYAAMFEAGIAHGDEPELGRQADRAFDVLRQAAIKMHARLPEDRRAPALMIALHLWTLSHGTASLFLRGDNARRTLPVSPEELLESGVLIYLDGLGRTDPD